MSMAAVEIMADDDREEDVTKNALIPRATVKTMVANRNRALELYAEAHVAIARASEAIVKARLAGNQASPGLERYNYHSDEARKTFVSGLDVPDRDEFLALAQRLTDTDVWASVVTQTDLERLMDKKAKDDLHSQLMDEPPEVTVENIYATLQQFAADADMIFRRGIAEVFSNLDRRFRSHDGWKIGSRVILTRAFDEWGHWNHYRNHRDTIIDIERTFCVLDGGGDGRVGGLNYAIDAARSGQWGARQSVIESEFFKVCIYKNGNAHIWFKRDDLVEKVNKLLAEYYGEVISRDREPEDDGDLFTPKMTPAKNFGFYPTPNMACDEFLDNHCSSHLYRRDEDPPLRILEPSAGTGQLSRRLAEKKNTVVDCVEIQPALAADLQASGLYRRVTQADFLSLRPSADGLYDRIIMNPPFDLERDIDHVIHAMKFLKEDGFLAAIVSAGTEFRETRKAKAFRELMGSLNAVWRDMPAGSFASVGTYVNTATIRFWKSGRWVNW